MKLELETTVRTGPAVDARDRSLDADSVLAAIRDPDDPLVSCPPPGPLHDHVGHLHPGLSLARGPATACAARALGLETSHDEELERLRDAIAAVTVPDADVPDAVATVADAEDSVDELRDRVARLGGIVTASQDPDRRAETRSDLRAAAAALADAETTVAAAREALARERERQRAANDARERRLRLEDRLGNRQRTARRELADALTERLARARTAVPNWRGAGADAILGLALARLAPLRAPVVVEDGPFRTAVQARGCLAAPVVLVD